MAAVNDGRTAIDSQANWLKVAQAGLVSDTLNHFAPVSYLASMLIQIMGRPGVQATMPLILSSPLTPPLKPPLRAEATGTPSERPRG